MANEQTGKSTLGALRLQYLGGDGELAANGGQMYWGTDSFVSPQNVFIANTIAGPDCYNVVDNGSGSYTINGDNFFLQAIFPVST